MKKGIVILVGSLLIAAAAFGAVKIFWPKKDDKDGDNLLGPGELNKPADKTTPAAETPHRTDPPADPPRTVDPPLAPGKFTTGSDVWVNKNAVTLYNYPSFNNPSYIAKTGFNLSVKKLGKYVEPATAGWAKISVAKPYGVDITGDYFVPETNLKNTAY